MHKTDLFRPSTRVRRVGTALAALGLAWTAPAWADAPAPADQAGAAATMPADSAPGRDTNLIADGGARLLLTGGVSTIEGAGGGGLVPWALIGGYGAQHEVGLQAFGTGVSTQDFRLYAYGASANFGDRIEVSLARQNFHLRALAGALGLGNDYTISQTIIGAKLRLIGNAVLDQNTLLPQISVGAEHKINDDNTVVGGALGLKRADTDFYLAATKLFLGQNLLVNGTVRLTRANQYGILGFGGLGHTDMAYKAEFEGSAAYLITRKLAVGGEVRTKPNQLEGALGGTTFKEQAAWDGFVAYAVDRHLSVTAAYADLGQIALRGQHAAYLSLQAGF
jgi:hypothetical protein